MFPHAILEVFPCYCYNLNLNWGAILNRNLKHSNSIQYYHSRINDAMMVFLHMYEPEHQFFLCPLGLIYCILYICLFSLLFLSYCIKELYIIAKDEYLLKKNQNTFFGFNLPWTLMFWSHWPSFYREML